jgi:hypothetical protein
MSKGFAIFLIVIAFVVGVVAGGWIVGGWIVGDFYTSRVLSHEVWTKEQEQMGEQLSLLTSLRQNDTTNTIEHLETRLDSSILTLGFYLKYDSNVKSEPKILKKIQMAKSYREKYPHKTSDHPEIDESVSNILSLVNENGQ